MSSASRCRPFGRLAAVLATAAAAATTLPTAAVAATLPTPKPPVTLPAAIEPMPPYQPQTFCDPVTKPGVTALGALLTATYRDTSVVSTARTCGSDTSEHYDGRALDWGAYYKNATQVAEVNAVFAWLFAKDAAGNDHAMLRRLGIMYIIWNKQIWGVWSQKWEPYACSGETACHQNHVHFSLDWSGALKKTSFWTGVASTPMTPPHPELTSLTVHRVVTVPANRALTTTSFWLHAGYHYRLIASGVYLWRPVQADAADAECSRSSDDATWRPFVPGETSMSTAKRDVIVNGTLSGWRAVIATGGGCNAKTHTYSMTITPVTSGPLSLSINDSSRSDDVGSISVTVSRVP